MAIGSVLATAGTALSQQDADHLRTAAISVAVYEYILTLPAEYRFYSTQSRWKRPSLACMLFVLIRYSSVLVLVISNVGHFAPFSEAACNRYYLVSPVCKVLQIIICQIILSVRTFAISRQSRTIAFILGFLFLVCTVGEGVTTIYARVPNNSTGHCTPGNPPNLTIAWLFHVFSMSFDLATLIISSWYLLGRQPCAYLSFGGISRVMIVDGLGYFVLLTAVNIVNVIFYKTAPTSVQTSGASLGYVVTMIGCQRILIHLRDIADHSSNWTPKRPTTNGVGDGDRAHELAIRVTIQRDVEQYANSPNATKSSDTISTRKEHGVTF